MVSHLLNMYDILLLSLVISFKNGLTFIEQYKIVLLSLE